MRTCAFSKCVRTFKVRDFELIYCQDNLRYNKIHNITLNRLSKRCYKPKIIVQEPGINVRTFLSKCVRTFKVREIELDLPSRVLELPTRYCNYASLLG